MGNTPGSPPATPGTHPDFPGQLTYLQQCTAPHTGSVRLHRHNQPPYDYIIQHKRIFSSQDPLYHSYLATVQKIAQQLRHKNIVQVHHVQPNTVFGMCGKMWEVDTYWSYYSLTLEEVVKKRRNDDVRFTANELWYVLKSLLEISVLLRKHGYEFGAYRARNITMSEQGYLKLYILDLNQPLQATPHPDAHSAQPNPEYLSALNDRGNLREHLPLPPEFIPSLTSDKCSYSPAANPVKQDTFMIGMVMLEMLINEDIRKYYSMSSDTYLWYKQSSVWKDLGMLGYVYDRVYFLPLLERMLADDPAKRITPEQALGYIGENRDNITVGGSLRMYEDEENHIKPKISYRTSFDFQGNMLKSLEPNILELKLTACPIKTTSKRNNKSTGVSLTSSKQSAETRNKSLTKSKVLEMKSRGSSLSTKVTCRRA